MAWVSLELWRGCPDRLKAGIEVARRPLGMISYHQTQKIQSLLWVFAAKSCVMKTMH
jgi:hypothetical protein